MPPVAPLGMTGVQEKLKKDAQKEINLIKDQINQQFPKPLWIRISMIDEFLPRQEERLKKMLQTQEQLAADIVVHQKALDKAKMDREIAERELSQAQTVDSLAISGTRL